MKLRALGTGHAFSRWPLIPPCWLIQSEGTNILINCPTQAGARLEAIGLSIESVDMIVPLGSSTAQCGGLDEFGYRARKSKTKPYLASPLALQQKLRTRLEYPTSFAFKAVKRIGFTEEHISEELEIIDNLSGGYGFRLSSAKIFCSGSAEVNEDWLFQNLDCDLLLHEERESLEDLPVYIQDKIWIYGYHKIGEGSDPLPMLLIPQNSVIYDSDRRDKTLTKERFIRENAKKQLSVNNTLK